MGRGLVTAELDTATLPCGRRNSDWEAFNARRMVRLACRTLDERGVIARQLNIRGEGHVAIHIEGMAHSITRGVAEIDASPAGMVQISLVAEGEVYFQSPLGMHHAMHGDLLVFDTDQPYALTMPRPVVMRSLHVPRASLPALAQASLTPGRAVWRQTGHSDPSRHRALVRCLDQRFADPGTPRWSVREALGHVEALLTPTDDQPAGACLHRAALDEIDARLRNAFLRLADIAAAVHVSERQLARVFASRKTTFTEAVISRRLDVLTSDLSDPANQDRSTADLILGCGFKSVAHGHRRFAERTGTPPGRFRTRSASA